MTTKPNNTKPAAIARAFEPIKPAFAPLSAAELASRPIRDLFAMHTYRRAAGSRGEAAFIARYVDSIPGIASDKHGNRFIRIGDSPVIWSSHTDSVHGTEESRVTPFQRLSYGGGFLSLHHDEKASCLGADCAAGVWIMREMIARGVQGLFVFHAAEEIGGIGSARFVEDNADMLRDFVACIAFDRRGTQSIITHQGLRTCSDAFGDSLASMLGDRFVLDDSGTFTDSANYARLVAECSNLSVGYYSAHTSSETLDVAFCAWLLERLCVLDASRLVVARDLSADRFSWCGREEDEAAESLQSLCDEDSQTAAEMLADLGVTPREFLRWQRERHEAQDRAWAETLRTWKAGKL